MKKILALTIGLILMTSPLIAADGDITKAEVRPDVATYQLDTVKFLVFTKTCVVTYRKVDSNGDPIGEEFDVIFSDTEFTQLIQAINNGSNIKTTVKNAVKTKLGL